MTIDLMTAVKIHLGFRYVVIGRDYSNAHATFREAQRDVLQQLKGMTAGYFQIVRSNVVLQQVSKHHMGSVWHVNEEYKPIDMKHGLALMARAAISADHIQPRDVA